MEFIVLILLSFILGAGFCYSIMKSKTLGVIRMARSDPDEPPYLFLELNTSVDDVLSKKLVMFEVSQK